MKNKIKKKWKYKFHNRYFCSDFIDSIRVFVEIEDTEGQDVPFKFHILQFSLKTLMAILYLMDSLNVLSVMVDRILRKQRR